MPRHDSAAASLLADEGFSSSGERRVGVPVHETALTNLLARRAGALFPPGGGRSSWLILEPQTGFGIPDVLIVHASMTAVSALRSRGLRLPTLSAARVLANGASSAAGVSPRYAQSLLLRSRREGWTSSAIRATESVVADSLAIEVKLSDARRALQQLSKFRVSAHRAALCMPLDTSHRASRQTLARFGAGLLTADGSRISWEQPARYNQIPTFRRLWLAELLLRSLETDSAYRLSASRNRSIAVESDRTRPS